MSDKTSKVVGIIAIFAIGSAITFGRFQAAPPEKGVKYLRDKGYKNIQGGQIDSINNCGKRKLAREYDVVSPAGQKEKKIVCFGAFGPYEPLF